MNPYLQRLKKNTGIREVSPTKPTAPSFDGFVGSTMADSANFFLDSHEATSVDETEAMLIARRAIAMAALTDEQKAMRLADLRRDPAIARFWALAWPDAVNHSHRETP